VSVETDQLYEARLEIVDFLVDAYADYPPEELLERLLDGEFVTPDGEVSETLDAGFDALERFAAEHADETAAAVREELELEYSRLFVGPRPVIQPHETYFREDTDFRGKGLAKVEASYGAGGWTAPDDYPEEDDHVAVEMAFLRYLIRRQQAGDEEAFGFQRVFHEEHLSQWIDEFAREVVDETDSTFYEAAAYILSGFVAFEEEIAGQMT